MFFFTFMLPKITMNWDAFLRELPQYLQKIKLIAMEWKARIPDRYGSEEIQWLLDKASANVDTAAEKTGAWAYGFAGRIFFNLFNIVLSPILVFFMLYYKQSLIETLASWIPEQRRTIVLGIGQEVNSSIGGYLRGQVFVSLIVAVLATLALFVLSIPHPLFCGVFAGAASILPFIGVIIAILPALFFAWFQYQSVAVTTEGRHRLRGDLFPGRLYHQTAGLQEVHEPQPAGDHHHGHGPGGTARLLGHPAGAAHSGGHKNHLGTYHRR